MDIDNIKKFGLFSRRAFIASSVKFSFMSLLLGRLFYLQFLKYDDYIALSDNNRVRINLIIPLRGKIYDIKGVNLADNIHVYRLFYDKSVIVKDSAIKLLVNLINFPEDDIFLLKEKILSAQNNKIILYDNLSWQQISKIEENINDLPGMYIDTGHSRYYPENLSISHIIGYVGSLSSSEQLTNSFIHHPEIKVGKSGIEKINNSILQGEAGYRKSEVNAKGIVVKELAVEKSVPGNSINLTINIDLQNYIFNLMQNNSGAAVLLDVNNGHIVSMVSTPSFDLNQIANGISNNDWNEIINNPYLPLTNKAISMVYPPGSPFKLMVTLAALKNGIDPEKRILCSGGYTLGNRKFHCWKKSGHGWVNLHEALIQSCNCYIYEIAREIGIEEIVSIAKKFSLGSNTDISLPREASGALPNVNGFFAKDRINWRIGDTLNCALGQGFILATPLQLAVMTARVATNKYVKPSIVLDDNQNHKFEEMDIDNKFFTIIRKAMYGVVNDSRGTCYRNSLRNGIKIAGKSGTSQVISKRTPDEDLSKDSVLRKIRNHGLFVGYAPYDEPKYACCIFHENAGKPSNAIKNANKIINYALKIT